MKHFVFSLFIVAFLTLLVILFEYAVRMTGVGDPVIYEIDYTYRFAASPDQRKERRRGAVVTINESGLRANEPWRDAAGHKVLFVGDSVTYGGSYVDNSELFSEIFCAAKEQEMGMPVVCGNAGINSYGILNMSMRLRFDARIQDANTIIVVVLPGDAYRGLVDGTAHHYFTKSPQHFFSASHELLAFITSRAILTLAKQLEYTPANREAASEYAVANLADTIRQKEADGAKVYVVISSPQADLSLQGDFHKFFVATMTRHFPDVLFLSEPLGNTDDAFYDAVHYERAGHRAVGEYLAEKISLAEPQTP